MLESNSDSMLLAYGGETAAFSGIDFDPKVFIDDARLRLKDQQREQQSWSGVLTSVRNFLNLHSHFDYVYLVEYDQIPLVADLLERMADRIRTERADVLAHHLNRIDQTSSAHYLYHARDKRFHDYFTALSLRGNPRVILSMLGTGSFWKRKAFTDIAALEEPFPIYLEIYLPTLAHHLGFRVRDISDQNKFVMHIGNRHREIETARKQGAWTLHPVKTLPAVVNLRA